ncbi:MAG TPA: HAMP domain-containing sensor histidine kinase [Candidatus Acidoferrales bacterium]|nr:HAMP domain-containing sensor histidine kinase [Candidatus Acidoferrales bacterium]
MIGSSNTTKRRRSDGSRVLILELAIVLPALALILFSVLHLKSLRDDHAIEAAIQRDFEQMLAISEKQMSAKAYELVDAAVDDFAMKDDGGEQTLSNVLARHSYVAHAFLFDQKSGVFFASRRSRMDQRDFEQESEKTRGMLSTWIPMEGKEIAEKLATRQEKHGRPYMFDYTFTKRGDSKLYQWIVLFRPKDVPKDHVAIGAVVFDAEYMRDTFFPGLLDYLADCPENAAPSSNRGGAAMMLSARDEMTPVATSSNYNGGKPEVQRAIIDTFPGLTLGIRYRGTTISALSAHFLRTNYLVLGGLSLLMAGGIFLSYRNINREIALAKLKSDFVSNVSHELRTPLSSIRLYAETLEMGRLKTPEKYQEYYRTIRKESERLTALINNILDFARIEAGRKEYDFRETDIGELVRNTLDSCRFQFEQQGFTYEEHIEPDLPKVRVDREAIERSVLNLVNNAVKYSSSEKFLHVGTYRENGSVKIEVIDHGIGIQRSEHNKIFEKFYRTSDPLVHNTKGSGLGLSLVKHVVEAHGGEVAVSSAPGEGSRFTITLPVETQAKSAATGRIV